MAKEKKLLSLDSETKRRLEKYAEERHTTVSQAVTDWIWAQKINQTDKKTKELELTN